MLARLQERERQLHSVRARFTATVTTPHSKRQLDGILLTGEGVRFRLSLPFGMTVFDLVETDDGAIYVYTPSDELAERLAQDGLDPLSLPDLFRPGDIDASRCTRSTGSPDGLIDVECSGRRLTVRRSDATIATEWKADRIVMAYDDYRPANGIEMPYRIVIRYPGDVVVTVGVENYEVNPVFDGGAFEPPSGAKLVVMP